MARPSVRLDYPVHERRLDNGLRVVVNPDHSTPTVAVNLWYNVGSRHELRHRTGFAHLFEHLMFQGSGHVESGQHIAILEAAGATANATTSFDRTNYYESGPAGVLDLALWLEADRMGTLLSALDRTNLDNQRDVVKEEKRQRYDNVPYGDAYQHLLALSFPERHPYSHPTIGSMEDLDAATLDDVRIFFQAHYMPGNAVLSIVGDVTPDEAWRKAEHYFSPIAARVLGERRYAGPLPPLSGLPRVDLAEPVPADAVYLAWRLPALDTPAYDAVGLALDVLGDGQTSRLHQALVRDRGLAESAGTGTVGLIDGTSLGVVVARAREDTTAQQLEEAAREVLADYLATGPTSEELARARAQHELTALQDLASSTNRADLLSAYATLRNDPTLVNRRLHEVLALSDQEIADCGPEHLGPAHHATVAYHSTLRGSTS
ncbi:M16 family metallopeptidase [Raineyella fluvialis]|uniref:Peptidase M16 n=1 Tax=Raineyella fluvialis TaxID=2662261 RepID=A0A5Q2FCB2_9ACTN|nr:pitrilysin family protein [Raineyella fluvialis]QGF24429.1 peptidase M16 [Raineyella fluvialis]